MLQASPFQYSSHSQYTRPETEFAVLHLPWPEQLLGQEFILRGETVCEDVKELLQGCTVPRAQRMLDCDKPDNSLSFEILWMSLESKAEEVAGKYFRQLQSCDFSYWL